MNTWNFHFPEGSCQLYFCVFPPLLPARHKVGPKFVRSRRRSSAGSRRSMEAGSAVASVPPMAMRRQSVRLCITAPRRCRLSRSTSRRPVAKSTCGLNVRHERANLLRCVRPFMAHLCRPAGPAACPLLEVFLPRRVTSVPYRGTALAQVLATRWHPNDGRKRTTLRRLARGRGQDFHLSR